MGLIDIRKQKIKEIGYFELLPRLVTARKKSGVMQKDLAKEIGVDVSTICRFESGARISSIIFDQYMDRFGGDMK